MLAKEHARRRKRLMQMMGEGAVAILPAAPQRPRNRDVHFPYRQDSDFHYLTGFPEPEAVAVLAPGREHGEYLLFCRERDPEREIWDGRRAGQEGAVADYGADDSFPIDDIDDILPGILERSERVYYTMGVHHDFDQLLIGWINRLRSQGRAGVHAPDTLVALDHLLHDMRLYKSAAEIKLMRHAAEVSARAHARAMQQCRPGLYEYQVEAELLHEFGMGGCRVAAYPSIVGGGANACILHYIDNAEELRDGELLLIDAGAEYECYASDITRTFPVNGRFSAEQRAVYEVVLAAQLAAIEAVRPGNHWNTPHEAAVRVLTEGLVDLGLLHGAPEHLIEEQAYRRFYMHRTGHWLGMDVHDVGDYKVDGEWRVLEPGMVMTVEPGLYISAGSEGVDERWWNIGVRIEDDVLVTRTGHDILSKDAPKQPDEIEALMAGS
ncbi:Xaa-Pro aminopeptidase [Ectothiorhodospiraceae bacterium 2226]|nr:Xaa-Pro aminopeptidase [Ectothiorhodospiraceae bacterium 2226]